MAVTLTPRLQLAKQDDGDADWGAEANTGYDNADERLLQVSSDNADQADPNGPPNIAGAYIGQRYIDETVNPPRVFICTTPGVGVSVWRLISTDGVIAPVAVGGNTNLDDILNDFQTRILAAEAALLIPPRGHIDGLISSWAAAGAGIDFTAGECADTARTKLLELAAIGKLTNSAWVAGDGNGGLSSSLVPLTNGEWYHMFACFKSGTGEDIGFDSDIDGANLVSDHGLSNLRRIGSFKCQAAATAAVRYIQIGDLFIWYTPIEVYNDTDVLVNTEVEVTLDVPPDIKGLAIVTAEQDHSASGSPGQRGRIWHESSDWTIGLPDGADMWHVYTTPGALGGYTRTVGTGPIWAPFEGDQKVTLMAECSEATIDELWAYCYGWVDPRGRNS